MGEDVFDLGVVWFDFVDFLEGRVGVWFAGASSEEHGGMGWLGNWGSQFEV